MNKCFFGDFRETMRGLIAEGVKDLGLHAIGQVIELIHLLGYPDHGVQNIPAMSRELVDSVKTVGAYRGYSKVSAHGVTSYQISGKRTVFFR